MELAQKPTSNTYSLQNYLIIFQVESKAIKEIEFVADFTGSENIRVESAPMYPTQMASGGVKQEKNPMVVTKNIGPQQFTLKNPPLERQRDLIRKYLMEQKQKIKYAREALNKIPYSLMSIEDIEKKVQETKLSSFIDLEFEPLESSVYDSSVDNPFDVVVHWRRPHEFMLANFQEGLLEPNVFYDTIEPNDIKPGVLCNEWFLSALAMLAERPALIERLFLTKEINQAGVYRVKLCKNGEWITVTVDDFFPCYPEGDPLFSRCHGNELWPLILEKAYAKLHGNYFLLRGGYVIEALLDLTGCPSMSYDLDDEYVKHFIENGQFWELIKFFDDEGYLISFSSHGECRWVDNLNEELKEGQFPKGQAFTIVLVKEVHGNQLLNIRSPLQEYEWNGDWGFNSSKWTPQIKDAIGPNLVNTSQEDSDGTFWMSYQDAISKFKSLNVCRIRNWEEVRIKGKYIRVQDIDDPSIEVVLSKWYYSVDLHEPTRIFVGLHQEDERIKGVLARRPYLDVGIAILRRTTEGVELVDLKDFVQDRQCEIEVNLEPGSYIILPRTSGCLLRRPETAQKENIQLMNSQGQLNELFEITINDIFRKFDMLLNRELSFCEFKGFCECINRNLTEKEFQQDILHKYTSTSRGITLKGFKEFFEDQLQMVKNSTGREDQIWQWLENLGYDRDLYSVRSRCFILTLHSQIELSVTVRDAVQTDLDSRTNLLIIEKFGQELESKKGYKILYTFSEQVHAYSYAVQNLLPRPVDATLDCSKSENMTFSSKENKISKRVESNHTEFMMHSMAMPNASKFVRSAKCVVKEVPQQQ